MRKTIVAASCKQSRFPVADIDSVRQRKKMTKKKKPQYTRQKLNKNQQQTENGGIMERKVMILTWHVCLTVCFSGGDQDLRSYSTGSGPLSLAERQDQESQVTGGCVLWTIMDVSFACRSILLWQMIASICCNRWYLMTTVYCCGRWQQAVCCNRRYLMTTVYYCGRWQQAVCCNRRYLMRGVYFFGRW